MTQLVLDIDDHTLASLQHTAVTKRMTLEQAGLHLLETTLFGRAHRSAIPLKDYVPQHVPVLIDPKEDRIEKPFRCTNCGNTVFNYYGSIKLITYGHYDADNNMVDGEDTDWFSKLGEPTIIVCAGRLLVQLDDGRIAKARCRATYYKIGA